MRLQHFNHGLAWIRAKVQRYCSGFTKKQTVLVTAPNLSLVHVVVCQWRNHLMARMFPLQQGAAFSCCIEELSLGITHTRSWFPPKVSRAAAHPLHEHFGVLCNANDTEEIWSTFGKNRCIFPWCPGGRRPAESDNTGIVRAGIRTRQPYGDTQTTHSLIS